jgi:hypothetical protein
MGLDRSDRAVWIHPDSLGLQSQCGHKDPGDLDLDPPGLREATEHIIAPSLERALKGAVTHTEVCCDCLVELQAADLPF